MVKEFKEKIITINLRKAFEKPTTKRAKSALYALKKAVRKETKKDNIKISNKVNEELWKNGLFKSLRKITVKVVPEKDIIRVLMPNEKIEVKKEEKPKTIKDRIEKAKAGIAKEENKTEDKKEEKNKQSKDEKEAVAKDKNKEKKEQAEKVEEKPKKETEKKK